jgi:hypothetical protein
VKDNCCSSALKLAKAAGPGGIRIKALMDQHLVVDKFVTMILNICITKNFFLTKIIKLTKPQKKRKINPRQSKLQAS